MHKNIIEITLEHAWHKYGYVYMTGREIYLLQDDAYDGLFSDHLNAILENIKRNNGYTLAQWDEVMRFSGSFYFIPDESMIKANTEIKQAITDYHGYLVPRKAWYDHYMYQILNQQATRQKPRIKRSKRHGVWYYSLVHNQDRDDMLAREKLWRDDPEAAAKQIKDLQATE
jgi:hypothetical protein